MTSDVLEQATKDDLVLAMLAVLGGDRTDVNERDLFLASWHAFPNTMRWVDTPLPNPDTFTASLRRLDQRGLITRQNKQNRKNSGRRRRTVLDPTRSGVVKARIADGGLEQAGVTELLIDEVRRLRPHAEATRDLSDAALISLCIGLREANERHVDEGAVVELAFHKFPDRFAYAERKEFPDTQRIRSAIADARREGLVGDSLRLTAAGRRAAHEWGDRLHVRLDVSRAHAAGDLRFASRVERTAGFKAFDQYGTLVQTKADELFRALRVPPTADPTPVATTLETRVLAMRRIDKGKVADYLLRVAQKHNPEVSVLVAPQNAAGSTKQDSSTQQDEVADEQ